MNSKHTTTNITRGTTRIRLTADFRDGARSLVWAELYERGVLVGCGPTLAGLSGGILHDCEMRLADGFEDSMLWRGVAS